MYNPKDYSIKHNKPETLDKSESKYHQAGMKSPDFINDDYDNSETHVLSSKKLTEIIPTKVSDLSNDASEYIRDASYIIDLIFKNKFSKVTSKKEYYNKSEFIDKLKTKSTVKIKFVDELPVNPRDDIIYALRKTLPNTEEDVYDEYIYIDGEWQVLYEHKSYPMNDYYEMSEVLEVIQNKIKDDTIMNNATWSSEYTRTFIEDYIDSGLVTVGQPRELIHIGNTTANYWTFESIDLVKGVSASLKDICVFVPGGESENSAYNDIVIFNKNLTGWRYGDVLPGNFLGYYNSVKTAVSKDKMKAIIAGGGLSSKENEDLSLGIVIHNDGTVTSLQSSISLYQYSTIASTKNYAIFAGGYDNGADSDTKNITRYDFEDEVESVLLDRLIDFHTNGTGLRFNNNALIIGGFGSGIPVKSIEVITDDGSIEYYPEILRSNDSIEEYPTLACVLGDKILVTGYSAYNKYVDVIDKNFTYVNRLELPYGCFKGSIDVIGDCAVIFGGIDGATEMSNKVQVISKDLTISVIDTVDNIIGRNNHLSATIGDSLYVAGGYSNNEDHGTISVFRYVTKEG